MLLKKFGFPMIAFEGEGAGSGGGDASATAAPQIENVLFPDEKATASATADDKGTAGEASTSAGNTDWKEYENDPAKSAEENAAAKAEHDKSKPAPKDDPADKVPEDGKYSLTMPDGVELDAELAEALGPEFKELGLTNAQANKLVGKYIETMQKRGEAHAASPEGAWSSAAHDYFKANGTPDKWADTAKADKDIGGAKWDGTVSDARRAIDKLGTPALKDFLNASGGGNHPELIRMFAKAGALIKEDNPPNGDGKGSGKPVEPAHILFKDDAPKG